MKKLRFHRFFADIAPLLCRYMIWLLVLHFITIYGGQGFLQTEKHGYFPSENALGFRLTRMSVTDIIKRKVKKHGAAVCSAAPCMFLQKEFPL
nr:hypothetical protein [uncultured Agathobaculum sp.]